MKPSGIEWIGDIPDDWQVRKLLSLFKEHKDRNKNLEEQNLLSLSYGKIKRKDINNNDGLLPASFETYNIVEKGDIVFRLTDLQNDKRSLRTGIVTQRGIITSAYVTIRPKIKLDSRFYHYLYHMYDICKVFYGMGDGVRQGMGFEDLKNIPTLIPPLKTQEIIADYLDEKCGEIDATITKQKESIEKLKAYKQSLISETVTKGLDKSAPLKPSGIDYLGDIPNDWEVIKTKFLFNVYGGSTPKINVPEYWGDKITWITPGELGDDIKIVLNSKRMLSEKGLNSCGATLVSKGSIIISNRAPIGQVCLAGSELCTNQGCKSLVAKIKLSCLFFYYFFKVQSEVLNMLGNGTTFMELSTSDLLNFKIPCPTIKEQQKIADYLDSKCSQIDKYITEKQNIIQKLDAYKKSLIFEYVTGKHYFI